MRTVGVIAEYNPFHLGHAYHLQQARQRTPGRLGAVRDVRLLYPARAGCAAFPWRKGLAWLWKAVRTWCWSSRFPGPFGRRSILPWAASAFCTGWDVSPMWPLARRPTIFPPFPVARRCWSSPRPAWAQRCGSGLPRAFPILRRWAARWKRFFPVWGLQTQQCPWAMLSAGLVTAAFVHAASAGSPRR